MNSTHPSPTVLRATGLERRYGRGRSSHLAVVGIDPEIAADGASIEQIARRHGWI